MRSGTTGGRDGNSSETRWQRARRRAAYCALPPPFRTVYHLQRGRSDRKQSLMRRLNQRLASSGGRRLGLLATSIAIWVVCASSAQAFGDDPIEREGRSMKGRAGLAVLDVDLPFDFRARLDGFYSRTRHAIDALAYNRWFSPGPAVQRDSLVESRVSIGREVWDGVELEVAWVTQNSFSFRSMSAPDRQTVGAFIRFTR